MGSNTKHTPGPWGHHRCGPPSGDLEIRAGSGFALAKIYETARPFANRSDGARAEADARLIAAAPDLLEALRIIVANAAVIPDPAMQGLTDTYSVPLDDIEVARAAIARAEGAAHA